MSIESTWPQNLMRHLHNRSSELLCDFSWCREELPLKDFPLPVFCGVQTELTVLKVSLYYNYNQERIYQKPGCIFIAWKQNIKDRSVFNLKKKKIWVLGNEEEDKLHPEQLMFHLILIRWLSILFEMLICLGGSFLPSLEVNIGGTDCK